MINQNTENMHYILATLIGSTLAIVLFKSVHPDHAHTIMTSLSLIAAGFTGVVVALPFGYIVPNILPAIKALKCGEPLFRSFNGTNVYCGPNKIDPEIIYPVIFQKTLGRFQPAIGSVRALDGLTAYAASPNGPWVWRWWINLYRPEKALYSGRITYHRTGRWTYTFIIENIKENATKSTESELQSSNTPN